MSTSPSQLSLADLIERAVKAIGNHLAWHSLNERFPLQPCLPGSKADAAAEDIKHRNNQEQEARVEAREAANLLAPELERAGKTPRTCSCCCTSSTAAAEPITPTRSGPISRFHSNGWPSDAHRRRVEAGGHGPRTEKDGAFDGREGGSCEGLPGKA